MFKVRAVFHRFYRRRRHSYKSRPQTVVDTFPYCAVGYYFKERYYIVGKYYAVIFFIGVNYVRMFTVIYEQLLPEV